MQISDVPIFVSADGSLSVGTPSIPLVGPDGVQLRGQDGKRRYSQIIKFVTPEARQTWQAAVRTALAAAGIGAGPQQISRETTSDERPRVSRAPRGHTAHNEPGGSRQHPQQILGLWLSPRRCLQLGSPRQRRAPARPRWATTGPSWRARTRRTACITRPFSTR